LAQGRDVVRTGMDLDLPAGQIAFALTKLRGQPGRPYSAEFDGVTKCRVVWLQ
jgi:hypothetical protein